MGHTVCIFKRSMPKWIMQWAYTGKAWLGGRWTENMISQYLDLKDCCCSYKFITTTMAAAVAAAVT